MDIPFCNFWMAGKVRYGILDMVGEICIFPGVF